MPKNTSFSFPLFPLPELSGHSVLILERKAPFSFVSSVERNPALQRKVGNVTLITSAKCIPTLLASLVDTSPSLGRKVYHERII